MFREKAEDIGRCDVLIFGQTGAGKSSIIDLLQGSPVDQSFDEVIHYPQHHPISHRDGKTYTFWNSPDLNESFLVKDQDAVQDLQSFVDDFNIDLLIYCIQDGVDMTRVSYDFVWRDLCKEKVPIVLVVTGLKGKPDGDEWWHKNEETIKEMKMTFDGHTCITSWEGMYGETHKESAKKIWSLVTEHCRHNAIVLGDEGAVSHTKRGDILIFGQTGAGKTSIINMLQGKHVDRASDDATHCIQRHHISDWDRKTYTFWNTPDLNESFPVKSLDAVQDLQSFVDEYTIDLLIYCIEDGLANKTRLNYDSVWRGVCKEKVPIMLVVTGLKGKLDGDAWWHKNEDKIEEMKMSFDGHVCIPSWRNMDDKEYAESAEKLWSLVRAHFGPKHNVILFGEGGAGKSSIVNMIVGKAVAKVSSALWACTFKNDAYEAIIGDKRYVIYDTAGLNEGEQGRVPHWEAIKELYTLIRELDGISLLVYCMCGRVRENARTNWNLFNKVICGGNVPIIAVVTGLENYGDPDDLLKDENNSDVFKKNGMEPRDVGCVVSIRGKTNQYADTYAKSQVKVRSLVTKRCLQKSWREEKEKWFATVYLETYQRGFFATRSRLVYSTQMRDALDEFIRETRMTHDDTEKLRATLLNAEKRYRRRLLH